MQGYVIRHGQPQEIASGPYQQYLFQITDANAESTSRDTPQKYLNAISIGYADFYTARSADALAKINPTDPLILA
jgi:hypothetical protein